MSLYDIPNMSSGIDDALVDTVSAVPSFPPLLLLFVFLTVLIGGSISQKRRLGSADVPMWATLSSIITLMISLIMTLEEGMIDPSVVSIVVVITMLSGFWFFFDRNRNEV